jgi:ABC-type phosphate transport system substrate-binding protein
VTALIKQTPGAVGYVEYGYAQQTKMPMAILENKSGKYVAADMKSEQAALADVKLPANLRAWIPDPAAPPPIRSSPTRGSSATRSTTIRRSRARSRRSSSTD